MSGIFTLTSFAAHLGAIEKDMHEVQSGIVARACEMLAAAIRENLGSYHFGWQHLKPETIARKMLGDTPLFETGELYNSIEWNATEHEGHVGTNSDRALWMEFGTSRGVPPRPFILPTAIQVGKKIQRVATRAVLAIMSGKGVHATEIAELIHLLKHVGHAVKSAVEPLFEHEKENRR